MNNSLTIVFYSAIFAIKITYLALFRKLIGRVHILEIWWWIVLAILVPAGIAATFLPFYNCPLTSPEQLQPGGSLYECKALHSSPTAARH